MVYGGVPGACLRFSGGVWVVTGEFREVPVGFRSFPKVSGHAASWNALKHHPNSPESLWYYTKCLETLLKPIKTHLNPAKIPLSQLKRHETPWIFFKNLLKLPWKLLTSPLNPKDIPSEPSWNPLKILYTPLKLHLHLHLGSLEYFSSSSPSVQDQKYSFRFRSKNILTWRNQWFVMFS